MLGEALGEFSRLSPLRRLHPSAATTLSEYLNTRDQRRSEDGSVVHQIATEIDGREHRNSLGHRLTRIEAQVDIVNY